MSNTIQNLPSPLTPPTCNWSIDRTVRTFVGTVRTELVAGQKSAFMDLAEPMPVQGCMIATIQLGQDFNGFDGRSGSIAGYLRRPAEDAAGRPTAGHIILSGARDATFGPIVPRV